VSLRALSVNDGFQLWARRFDRPAAELLQLNDEAAREIAAALTSDYVAPVRHLVDPVAVELFLRARAQLGPSWFDRAGTDRAIALYEQALTRAPDDPSIIAGLAVALSRQLISPGRVDHPDEVAARCRTLVDRAVSLAPHLGEPWQALAGLQSTDLDLQGAVRSLVRAVALAPSLATAQVTLGAILREVGLRAKADWHLAAAREIDPQLIAGRVERARACAMQGLYDEAEALLEPREGDDNSILDASRGRIGLWRAVVEGVVPPAAAAQAATAATEGGMNGFRPIFPLTLATGRFNPEHGRQMREWQRGARPRFYVLIGQFRTELHGFAGEHEAAWEALEDTVRAGLVDIVWMDVCPLFSVLREDPRYSALRATVAERAEKVAAAYSAH
jgi:serine/threonine-protein kinase